jgi:glutamate racemase
MTISAKSPIGIFDSGIGGLTVLKAVAELLPRENIIYYGDTIHLPYGDKSSEAIQNYSLKIVDFLLEQDCKLLLIACNSISAAAYQKIHAHLSNRVLLVDVIEPMVSHLNHPKYTNKKIGLIGTRKTIESNIYSRKIKNGIQLSALATPLLVPIIEEGFAEHRLADLALEEYLSSKKLTGIKALILGCTHYPILKNKIASFYHNQVEIIDSSHPTANFVRQKLDENNLLNQEAKCNDRFGSVTTLNTNQGAKIFYVSDLTDAFVEHSCIFFGGNVDLKAHPLL